MCLIIGCFSFNLAKGKCLKLCVLASVILICSTFCKQCKLGAISNVEEKVVGQKRRKKNKLLKENNQKILFSSCKRYILKVTVRLKCDQQRKWLEFDTFSSIDATSCVRYSYFSLFQSHKNVSCRKKREKKNN